MKINFLTGIIAKLLLLLVCSVALISFRTNKNEQRRERCIIFSNEYAEEMGSGINAGSTRIVLADDGPDQYNRANPSRQQYSSFRDREKEEPTRLSKSKN